MTLQDWGNIGQIAGGLTFIFLAYDLIRRKDEIFKSNYSEKLQRTFNYVNQFPNFNRAFYNFSRYISFKQNEMKEPVVLQAAGPQNATININLDKSPNSGGLAQIRMDLIDLYWFLKEICFILSEKKFSGILDIQILRETIKSYKPDIENFFKVAFEIIAEKEVKFGEIQLRGDFSRDDLVKLNNLLKEKFSFL